MASVGGPSLQEQPATAASGAPSHHNEGNTAIAAATAETRCPVCGAEARPWHRVGGYSIFECDACRHRFVPGERSDAHVVEQFDDAYFTGGGAGYPDYLGDGEILRARGRRYGQILARHMPPGRVLDVGAAAGFILLGLTDCGWIGRGLDPNGQMVAYGRERLGLDLSCGTLENLDPTETFDLVCMLQSIMHFYDLDRALTRAATATCPGGFWLIEAFNPHSWVGRALGRQWHDYNPPSVLHWFSPQALQILAERHGFTEVARGKAPKSISAKHAKSVLHHRLGNGGLGRLAGPLLAAIPDRLAIPYPGDDIFWGLYRKHD